MNSVKAAPLNWHTVSSQRQREASQINEVSFLLLVQLKNVSFPSENSTVKLAQYSDSTFTETKGNDHVRKREYILNKLNQEAKEVHLNDQICLYCKRH